MSGVIVIRHLLANSAAVLAIVPSSRIIAGPVPLATVLPALSITQIDSLSPFRTVRVNEANRVHSDRVQVSGLFYGAKATVPGTGYLGLYQLMKLVLPACPSQRATINSIVVDSIVPDIEGPDLYDEETDLHSKSRDFFVRWIGA